RKLGFRSIDPELMKAVLNEERKMATRPGYRTKAHTLRKLARAPMIFEMDTTKAGDWDRFQVRNIGLAVQRQMAARHGGDARRFRVEAVEELQRVIGRGLAVRSHAG